MAATDVFTLSSSPLKSFNSHTMSSSPVLPSPSELFKKTPSAICSGSRAASIPLNSPIAFTSAATLPKESNLKSPSDVQSNKSAKPKWRDGSPELLNKSKVTKPRAKKPIVSKKKDAVEGEPLKAPRKMAAKKDERLSDEGQPTKPKQSRAKKIVVEDREVKTPIPRKPRAKKATRDETGDEPLKEKPARKPRAKKSEEGQTKIPKGRVTKSSAGGASKKVKEALEIASTDASAESSKTPNGPVDYGLVKAVKRRTDWSPATASANNSFTSALLETEVPSSETMLSSSEGKGFGDLFGNFGSAQNLSTKLQRKVSDEGGTRKRKMIELVKTNISAASNASVDTTPKAKAPKKKARTITDLATSAYVEGADSDTTTELAPLLQYFSYQNSGGNNGATKVPSQPRTKATPKATKSRKDTFQALPLLSPTSALKQVGNQDFVFGTSSQLAREESPTYLRDLHSAMQASNEAMDDPFDDPFENPFDDPFADVFPEPSALTPTKVKRKTNASKGALWRAAARDRNGSLLEVEMVDLIDTPVSRTVSIQEAAAQMLMEDKWHDVDEEKTPTQAGFGEAKFTADLQEESPKQKPRSRSSSPKRSKVLKDKDVASTQPTKRTAEPKEVEMPDFETYTTAQLAAKVASYRFKPVKSRTAMISLLEQCWEGMNRTALKDLATNTKWASPKKSSKAAPPESSQSKVTLPKKAVGRPRKDSSVSAKASPVKVKATSALAKEKVDESDSDIPLSKLRTPAKRKQAQKQLEQNAESDTTTSPCRRRQTKTPPRSHKPFTSIPTNEISANELTPASDQATLFKYITRAIKSLPPTSDPQSPNWQEKILMYDPIVIEDLTVWLNEGALGKTGWDEEVGTKEVKRWCEGQGVCCLWRENLRGGSRARY